MDANQDVLVAKTADIVQTMIISAGPTNMMSLTDITTAISQVSLALQGRASEPAVIAEELVPAVPIRKSVTPEYLICLEDGKRFKSLKRHLRSHFNLTPEQYREKWGLPADYPMVAPRYSATRSQLAKDHGLGRKQ